MHSASSSASSIAARATRESASASSPVSRAAGRAAVAKVLAKSPTCELTKLASCAPQSSLLGKDAPTAAASRSAGNTIVRRMARSARPRPWTATAAARAASSPIALWEKGATATSRASHAARERSAPVRSSTSALTGQRLMAMRRSNDSWASRRHAGLVDITAALVREAAAARPPAPATPCSSPRMTPADRARSTVVPPASAASAASRVRSASS
mmetsp:Transcript_2671/g.10676  ORF Transcript_2671/g.10676 Transcript_2671/m.10676 type:complete len:214 (-) Transcript_2671:1537-2178(-)